MYLELATEMVKRHEGLRLKPYRCTAGKQTIGYGRNIEDKGISQSEAELLLIGDLTECEADLEGFPWWAGLSDNRKAVLIDMRFNLGGGGFRQFKSMIACIACGDFNYAAEEMLSSRWARQVQGRATELANLMRAG